MSRTSKSEANFFLRGEAYEIQSGLFQVWVVLHPKNSGEHLAGMDTATYVRMQPAGDDHGRRRLATKVRNTKPAIAGWSWYGGTILTATVSAAQNNKAVYHEWKVARCWN